MLRWLMRRRLDAFEKAYDHDMGYAREILDADPGALLAFSKVMGMSRYRQGVPTGAWYAAKLVATRAEDCGPCTQLVATMAEREGVAPGVLRAILGGDPGAMPEDVALAYRYSQAALAHDAGADAIRDEVVSRWGRSGLVSLAFAITSARMFPTLKYALGHGRSCVRVTVGGEAMPLAHRQEA